MPTIEEVKDQLALLTPEDQMQFLTEVIPLLDEADQQALLAAFGGSSVETFSRAAKVNALRATLVPMAAGLTAEITDWDAFDAAWAAGPPGGLPHPGDIRQDIQAAIMEAKTAREATVLFRNLVLIARAVMG